MPTCPSYSIMHSLHEGFSIVMYSGSHRVNLRSGFCLHKRCGIRIILPKWMAIIWHESLFHAGGKSRTREWIITLEDMRFFGYVWPKVLGNTRNRNVGSMDGIGFWGQIYSNMIMDKTHLMCYKRRMPRYITSFGLNNCLKDKICLTTLLLS